MYFTASECISLTQSSKWDISLVNTLTGLTYSTYDNQDHKEYLNARSEAGSEEGGVGWRPEHVSMN